MWLLIKKNKSFFITYTLFLIIGLIIQLKYSQAEIFLFFNLHFYEIGDYFFPYWTSVGDGLLSVGIILLLLLFRNYKEAVIFAIAFIVSGAITQFIKIYIWPDRLRPQPFFKKLNEIIHTIPGVDIHQYNSFPSGHSTSSFALFCCLTLIWNQKQWGWLMFVLAFSVGYSRMYLGQHFFLDVYTGSFIGVICSLFFYWLFEVIKAREWHNKALIRRRN